MGRRGRIMKKGVFYYRVKKWNGEYLPVEVEPKRADGSAYMLSEEEYEEMKDALLLITAQQLAIPVDCIEHATKE
jgi:PHD/YefM family antitoxin component YafN of YafNO toxin-antitoxin module